MKKVFILCAFIQFLSIAAIAQDKEKTGFGIGLNDATMGGGEIIRVQNYPINYHDAFLIGYTVFAERKIAEDQLFLLSASAGYRRSGYKIIGSMIDTTDGLYEDIWQKVTINRIYLTPRLSVKIFKGFSAGVGVDGSFNFLNYLDHEAEVRLVSRVLPNPHEHWKFKIPNGEINRVNTALSLDLSYTRNDLTVRAQYIFGLTPFYTFLPYDHTYEFLFSAIRYFKL
jgi:hypothetical protein